MSRNYVLPLLVLLMASSIAACASRSSTREIQTVAATAASLKADIPPEARKACEAAALPVGPHPGEREYQVFGVRQTTKLELCDGKRALAVGALDLHNGYVDRLVNDLRPKHWWEFWR